MRKMIESGDIAVPKLYSGMTQYDGMLDSKIELMSRAGGSSKGIIDWISWKKERKKERKAIEMAAG